MTKKVKYNVDGIELICDGIFQSEKLVQINCSDDNGTKVLDRKYMLNSDTSFYHYYFSSGVVKEKGKFLGENFLGRWDEYYENGNKKSVKYFRIRNDSSILKYVKNYEDNGNLASSILPIATKINNKDIRIDSTYELKISLEYSEFDTLKSIVFLDKNMNIEYERDSLLSHSKEVLVKFTPKRKGELVISGIYAELGKGITDERNIADRNFEKRILVK